MEWSLFSVVLIGIVALTTSDQTTNDVITAQSKLISKCAREEKYPDQELHRTSLLGRMSKQVRDENGSDPCILIKDANKCEEGFKKWKCYQKHNAA